MEVSFVVHDPAFSPLELAPHCLGFLSRKDDVAMGVDILSRNIFFYGDCGNFTFLIEIAAVHFNE